MSGWNGRKGVMFVNWLVIIVTLILIFSAIRGWRAGFVKSLLSIIGFLIVIVFAVAMTPRLNVFLEKRTDLASHFPSGLAGVMLPVIAFIICVVIGIIAIEVIGFILNKITEIPGLKVINRVFGAAVGFFKGLLFIWVCMYLVKLTAKHIPHNVLLVQIKGNYFLNMLYHHNLVADIFKGLM